MRRHWWRLQALPLMWQECVWWGWQGCAEQLQVQVLCQQGFSGVRGRDAALNAGLCGRVRLTGQVQAGLSRTAWACSASGLQGNQAGTGLMSCACAW